MKVNQTRKAHPLAVMGKPRAQLPRLLLYAYPSSSFTHSHVELQKPSEAVGKKTRAVRKATTNVLSLDLGTLANDAPLFTGDIVSCECGAAFNKYSVLQKGVEKTTWVCEFCNASQVVHLEEEEVRPT